MNAAQKAWQTRRANQLAKKRSDAAKKAWVTRRKALESTPGWQEFSKAKQSVADKKKQLLEMAKHPLASALQSYMDKSSNCYDPVFAKQIRTIDKKKQLLEMAKQGKPKPEGRPLLLEEVKKLAPHWFVDTVRREDGEHIFRGDRSKVAQKAWQTRRANQLAKKRSDAAKKAWVTRRAG